MRVHVLAAACSAMVIGAVSVALAAYDIEAGGSRPACVRAAGEARYRVVGYDHLVRVENTCDRRARCEVWTDVNTTRVAVALAPTQSTEVVTFSESPARTFRPTVECTLD
ncbi:MAG: hypothetical protein IT379_37110 [Deltaproteobacteria bacterium]|nr:hypothetical protein [Deltaproteobacteria bacterium]